MESKLNPRGQGPCTRSSPRAEVLVAWTNWRWKAPQLMCQEYRQQFTKLPLLLIMRISSFTSYALAVGILGQAVQDFRGEIFRPPNGDAGRILASVPNSGRYPEDPCFYTPTVVVMPSRNSARMTNGLVGRGGRISFVLPA